MFVLAAPAWAGYDEGKAAFRRGDYATALRDWQSLAEQGDAAAQAGLASMYSMGQGVPKNPVVAMTWYMKAADGGNAAAQFNLGEGYRVGSGVPQDYILAHMWLNIAAATYGEGRLWGWAKHLQNSVELK